MELEEVFTVHVKIEQPTTLNNDDGFTVVMIPFTGSVTGKYFEGTILSGGMDTQIIGKHGDMHTLSARYMLEGRDYKGEACKIYIENNGNINKQQKDVLFITYPKMITDSKALSFLSHDLFVGEGVATKTGLDIKVYRVV